MINDKKLNIGLIIQIIIIMEKLWRLSWKWRKISFKILKASH
jgi:hypothetical protein